MISYHCDGCGRELARDALRYKVKIDVRAAYDTFLVSLLELVRDHRAELAALIEQLGNQSAERIEETVYKGFELDLCPACQRAYIRDPLHFHPEQGLPEAPVDVDAFLRSLGLPPDEPGQERGV